MDETEKVVYEYLEYLDLGAVIYEPDGNVPPDFLVHGRIAVEARRLNQNEVFDSGYRGLEETAFPLSMKMRKLLNSFGPPTHGSTWFVFHRYQRPVEWNEIRPLIARQLAAFRQEEHSENNVTLAISDSFEIRLMKSATAYESLFLLGGSSDRDSGGWVLAEVLKNLQICLAEKTNKILPYKNKYPVWWLVLVDRIGFGVDERDRELYQMHLGMEYDWDKVILLSPLNFKNPFLVPRRNART